MARKPSIPKGTRDFGWEEMTKRNYIFDTIKSIFKLYGYQQIETPSMENMSTLMGKYGDEGDKLLFRILDSGEPFTKLRKKKLVSDKVLDNNEITKQVCEKGLRYDLTVPFARFVVQHLNDISFPFKRFQIQPVWRADRPQKGRYREFYQCDADVIGSKSRLNELELVQIMDDVFNIFDINVEIRINNRKVLTGFAEIAGFPEKVTDITVALDKLDKIGPENVKKEMQACGLNKKGLEVMESVLNLSGTAKEKIASARKMFEGSSVTGIVSETGLEGLRELEELFGFTNMARIKQNVIADFSLARGLDYYTGTIFEVKALDYEIGSICGGGRYDNLTGIFGLNDMSGVGISFGADRIYDVLKGLDKFPKQLSAAPKLLFANLEESVIKYVITIAEKLRQRGVSCEIYPEAIKLKKQFNYADRKGIPFISINGGDEIEAGVVNLKNLKTGEQIKFNHDDFEGIFKFLKNK